MKQLKTKLDISMDFETSKWECCKGIYLVTYTPFRYKGKDVLDLSKKDDMYIKKASMYAFSFEDALSKIVRDSVNGRGGKKGGMVNLWFQNSSKFDGEFILQWLAKNGYEQYLKFDQERLHWKQFTYLETDAGIVTMQFWYRGVCFTLRDFKLINPISVAEMGKTIKIPKRDLDHNTFHFCTATKQQKILAIIYGLYDSFILAHYLTLYEQLNGRIRAFTTAGLAFRELNNFCKKDDEIAWKIKNDESVWTLHYGGGFVYLNPKSAHKTLTDINYYDYNSMYPKIYSGPVPYDEGTSVRPQNSSNFTRLYKIKFIDFKMKEKYLQKLGQGLIKNRKKTKENDTRYSTHLVNIDDEIWEDELHILQKIYEGEFVILDTKYFNLKPKFHKYVEYKYDRRLKYKKECKGGNIEACILEAKTKVELNSPYGRFAMKPDQPTKFLSKELFKKGDVIIDGKYRVDGISNHKYGDLIKYEIVPLEKAEKRNNLYIASYITMKGREMMFKNMIKYDLDYIDTDGMMTANTLPEKLIHPTKLGYLKLEKKIGYMRLFAPKFYIYGDSPFYKPESPAGEWDETHMASKGVQKILIEPDTHFDDICVDFKGSSLQRIKTAEGVELREVFKELRSIRRRVW